METIIKKPPEICPYCGSDTRDTNYGFIEISRFSATQICTCGHCSKTWYEVYEFDRIELLMDA